MQSYNGSTKKIELKKNVFVELNFKTNVVDILNKKIYAAEIIVEKNKITNIHPIDETVYGYAIPGFVDAHIHIESSMLTPAQFAREAVKHGTVATVSDPHEIANVCGMQGIEYMLESASKVPFHFYFGAPSCVPATPFENAGALLSHKEVEILLQREDIYYLSEMMNFPGVIHDDEEVMKKIALSHKYKKPVDGHAPNVLGEDLKKYVAAGISTDHECIGLEEAVEKLSLGMKILIREGSAAKNYEALHPIISNHAAHAMFCSDDKHPDDLILGHINLLCARSIALGYSLYDVLTMACINPCKHYNLTHGTLNIGDNADFVILDNLEKFEVSKTIINGEIVYENGTSLIEEIIETPINHFDLEDINIEEFSVFSNLETQAIRVIGAIEGQLITESLIENLPVINNKIQTDINNDILKIVVINRYAKNPKAAVGFIKGFGLKEGAIASSIAHDSHNLLAVGVDDISIYKALIELKKAKGGIIALAENQRKILELPIAGLMSTENAQKIAKKYNEVNLIAKSLGSKLNAPFMTLSFMALPVIPDLKITDLGLFSLNTFSFCNLTP